ncbi:hypothetical protein ACOBQX_07170 [Actinokineospora sp. G85]|uniref:hypothetical protein n=1 Tax=Actinokineospora sp. G85 TaxID=3406626 RepID=UPI003C7638CE
MRLTPARGVGPTGRERRRALGVPVACTTQPGGMSEQDKGLLKDSWGPGMEVRPEHRRVVDPIQPAKGSRVFTK